MTELGYYHYLFVHFPIALIIMAGFAELIMCVKKKVPLTHTVDYLLISAALLTIPTVITGLSLEEAGVVSEANDLIFEWHESLAFATLSLAFATVFLRYWLGRGVLYFISLILLIISVALTAHFGGLMAFG